MKKDYPISDEAGPAGFSKSFHALIAACLIAFATQVSAQSKLLKEINTGAAHTRSYEYTELVRTTDRMYFESYGALYTSRGTAETTILLKRFRQVNYLTPVGNTLYFQADDGISGLELWKTTGSAASTVRVKDIEPGAVGSNPSFFTRSGAKIFFTANAPGKGGIELWVTDGTETGTTLVKDIMGGSGGSNPRELTDVNGTLYFTANDGQRGYELWRTNGTATGTTLVADIRTGSKISSNPQHLVAVNGKLFFSANDGVNGAELWSSDGTTSGTRFVKDIRAGSTSSDIENTRNVNGLAFFTATDGIHGDELWKSDGTPEGTVLVKDFTPGREGSNGPFDAFEYPMGNFSVINNALYFTGWHRGDGYFLARTDGTEAGTKIITYGLGVGLNPPQLKYMSLSGRIYFFFQQVNWRENPEADGSYGLYSMNTSGADVKLVRALEPPYDSYESFNQEAVMYNGKIYLNALDEGWKFRMIDPATGSMSVIIDTDSPTLSSNPQEFMSVNNIVFFKTRWEVLYEEYYGQEELWRTDGTPEGTFKISEINFEQEMRVCGQKLYYVAGSPRGHWGLFATTDGTPENTTLVYEALDGSGYPMGLTDVNGTLYFHNSLGDLWKSNGTASGTVKVRDMNKINSITNVNGKAFILHETPSGGLEVWRTNPTGLLRVKVIRTGPATRSRYEPTAGTDKYFYFVANDGIHGNEIWYSDGTEFGTRMTIDRNPHDILDDYGFEDDIRSFTVYNNQLYYSARDENNQWAFYSAFKILDMGPVNYSVVHNGKMFLFAGDEYRRYDLARHMLYVSDGRSTGTSGVGYISGYGEVDHAVVDNTIYFSSANNSDLMRYTECGGLARINTGVYEPSPLEAIGSNLVHGGHEPYVLENVNSIPDDCVQTMASTAERTTIFNPYPNPFSMAFSLQLDGGENELMDVSVFTAEGAPVESLRNMKANTNYQNIGAHWPKGVYIIKIVRGGEISTHRMIKQ